MRRCRGRCVLGVMVALAACTIPPAARSDPEASDPHGKADYYGDDDRLQIVESPDPRALGWARATAVMTHESWLRDRDEHSLWAIVGTLTDQHFVCPDERFAGEPALGFCSAFLIEPDLVVTAGHCIGPDTCPDVAFVFDYHEGGASGDIASIPRDRVYSCAAVVARRVEPSALDFAVVRLDRRVGDRAPLTLATAPPVGAGVALLGFPQGALAKIDAGGRVIERGPIRVVTSLDSFKGHSGGPVIDLASGRVFGVHVEGSFESYAWDGTCARAVACAEVTPGGSACLGSTEVLLSAAGLVDGVPTAPSEPGAPVVDEDTSLCVGPGAPCATDADCADVLYRCDASSSDPPEIMSVECDDGGRCAHLLALSERAGCPTLEFHPICEPD